MSTDKELTQEERINYLARENELLQKRINALYGVIDDQKKGLQELAEGYPDPDKEPSEKWIPYDGSKSLYPRRKRITIFKNYSETILIESGILLCFALSGFFAGAGLMVSETSGWIVLPLGILVVAYLLVHLDQGTYEKEDFVEAS